MKASRLSCVLAGVCALFAVGHVGLEQAGRVAAEAELATLAGAGRTVSHGAVAFDPLSGRTRVEDLRLSLPGGSHLSIGSVTLLSDLSMVGRALAAENVVLENIVVSTGPISVEMKRLEASSSQATRAQWAALFDQSGTTPLSARLAALSAESLSAPEIVVRSVVGDASTTVTYRDFRVVGLNQGAIRSLALSGGSNEAKVGATSAAQGSFGPVTVTDLDLVQLTRFYLEAVDPADATAKTVYGSVSAESITGRDTSGGRYAIRLMTGKDFRLRAMPTPLVPLALELSGKGDKLDASERRKLMGAVADMIEGIEIGSVEVIDAEIASGSGQDEVVAKIPRLALNGAGPGRPSAVAVNGIEFKAKDAFARIGSVSHTGWSYRPLFSALRELAGQDDFNPDDLDPRSFMPEFGSLTIRDIEIDALDPSHSSKDRFRFGVKTIELAASDLVSGVATSGRFALDRFTMAIPPNPDVDGLKEVQALGYRDLDLSAVLDSRWIEATNDFSINQLQLQGVNMGSLALRGVLGNVTKDVFAGDSTTSQLALLAATFKEARLVIENKGLAERLLDREAKKQKKSVEQFRKELGSMAQMAVPMMLGNSKAGATLGAAIARFIAKPTRLTIAAKARDPGGVGAVDVMSTGGDPGQVLDLLDITATND